MATEVEINSYQELMFGHFNTPAALDDLMGLLDWDEMYSAVELPAAALLVSRELAEDAGDAFDVCLYAIFGAERNEEGWRVRGIYYCACADGFEGQLSRECAVLTCKDDSDPVNVRFLGVDRDKYAAQFGSLPTQDTLNGVFSGNYGPYHSTGMIGGAKRAIRQIAGGKSLRDALMGDAKGEVSHRDIERQTAILKHLRGWYRTFRRNQALIQHRRAHGEVTKELSSVPAIREAVALANRELVNEKSRIDRSERSL